MPAIPLDFPPGVSADETVIALPIQLLSGASTCNGADFKITLNWNRTHSETGTATLQFCRDVRGLGDTPSGVARVEITRTMTQFASIKKVVITYKNGSCFDDLVGCD